jgi:hypothetical protein
MRHTTERDGRALVVALTLAVLLALPLVAMARKTNMLGAQEMLFGRGSAGVGVNGQVELILTSVAGETSWTWTVCNDGSDVILFSPGSIRGTALTTPAAVAEGTTANMGNVGRVLAGDCVEFGDLKASTAVLQGETTTQSFSVWGTR